MKEFFQIPPISISKINKEAEKLNCIRFDKGSANFPFPREFLPIFRDVLKEIKGKYFHYPERRGEKVLREEIAIFEEKKGRKILPENIVITHGGMSGLFCVFSLLCKKGDEIITNRYCFEGFSVLAKYFGLKQKRVNLSNLKEVEKAINSKTKILVFNSPENPTGKVYSREEVENLVSIAKKKKIWFLSDEVMREIIYEGKWFGPSLDYERTIVVNSFSKCWFVSGIRVGWVGSKNKRILEEISKLLDLQSIGVNLFGQILMAKILKEIDYEDFLKKRLKILSKRKKFFEQCLKKANLKHFPVEGGMNFYIDLKRDSEKLLKVFLKKKIAFIPGKFFEGKNSTFARFGFGAVKIEEIKKGIEIVKKLIEA